MRNYAYIWKRLGICLMLLSIQLLSIALPVSTAYRQMMAMQWDTAADPLPYGLAEFEQEGPEVGKKVEFQRRKTRIYNLSSIRQYSFNEHEMVLPGSSKEWPLFYSTVGKTGIYAHYFALLPAYYSFLFRLTPF